MSFYSLSKPERDDLVLRMNRLIRDEIESGTYVRIERYFSHEDTYVRKTAYLAIGKLYLYSGELRNAIISCLESFRRHASYHVRQTVINSAGEIGKKNFSAVEHFFDEGLKDAHHAPRNAVIGSIKKMGEVNPEPVLRWAKKYLHDPDKEIRREICHGIELRGRKHPEDILPLLQELEFDQTSRVRKTLVHVLGQIAYKKGCLEKVLSHLKHWNNQELVKQALDEILDVHVRYKDFAYYSREKASELVIRLM